MTASLPYNRLMEIENRSLKLTPKRIEALHTLGLHTAEDVLSYYPFRYDILNAIPFSEWREKEHVTFECTVVRPVTDWRRGKLITSNFQVMYEDQILKVTIFNRPWARSLRVEQRITITGVYDGHMHVTAMTYDTKPLSEHPRVTPVYSTREGIPQRTIRACIEKVYHACVNEITDIVPEFYRTRYRLLRHSTALRMIHFPENEKEIALARRTLKYEEFLKYFTAVQVMHNRDDLGSYKEPRMYSREKVRAVIRNLPYQLTEDQASVLEEILRDLSSPRVMYRLVQGDVGCGKTAVAALAMYACVTAGWQAALLAPTEILARQHLSSVRDMLGGTGVRTAVLYSGLADEEKADILEKTKNGEIDILIGTHSLLQENVIFRNIGLVIADEQQRFGVEQRRALKEKGHGTDFLLMSATPIPRTLAATLYGDMDISTIETMPAGRKAPVTQYIAENSFRSVLPDVRELLAQGHQLYVICAAVEKNEAYDARNVNDTAKALTKLFPMYTVGILHGQMKSEEKQAVMQKFHDNEIQILVSTTVVEVGMNVVNATGMIVYDAERFGLSQLHQLRGRIQRGSDRGHCWLLSGSKEENAKERLNVLVKSNNGFEIAYEDLRLRGPGDILGRRQSGVPDFILGNPVQDEAIVKTARADAEHILKHPDNPDFAAILSYAWTRADGSEGGIEQ